MAQAKPSRKSVSKKNRKKMKYPKEMYKDFDEVIFRLCVSGEIFKDNYLYDTGRWEELRENRF